MLADACPSNCVQGLFVCYSNGVHCRLNDSISNTNKVYNTGKPKN